MIIGYIFVENTNKSIYFWRQHGFFALSPSFVNVWFVLELLRQMFQTLQSAEN